MDVQSSVNYQKLVDSGVEGCTNYVRISPETLLEMERNKTLKSKVEKAIKEFCSSKEQAGIKALSPPVKSAGMVVNADGSTFYWLKGYSNEKSEYKKTKTRQKTLLYQRNSEGVSNVRKAHYVQLLSYLTGIYSTDSLFCKAANSKSKVWRNKNVILNR